MLKLAAEMGRGSCTALAFLFCMALMVSMEAECVGARVAPQVAAPAVASSISRPGHQNLDPFYGSKRRVPNGPDPIHNRRAGKSGRPSGRI